MQLRSNDTPFTDWHDKFMDWLIDQAIKRFRDEDAERRVERVESSKVLEDPDRPAEQMR